MNEHMFSEKKSKNNNISINFAGYDDNGKTLYYEKSTVNGYENDKILVGLIDIEIFCSHCKKNFPLRTKMHKHLKTRCPKFSKKNFTFNEILAMPIKFVNAKVFNQKQIIKSIASSANKNYQLIFRVWNCTEIIIQFTL